MRASCKMKTANDALLVTYTNGGVTPGDSYLWLLDDDGRPKAFKLWVSIIPIGGVEGHLGEMENLDNGLEVATEHRLGPVPSRFPDTAGGATLSEVGISQDLFTAVL